MAAATTPSPEAVEPSLGQVVLYHASDADDAAERTAFPLSSHMETFAAIVARESQLVELLGKYSPRVETYIQEFRQNRKGGPPVIAGDDYFLGRLEVREGVIERNTRQFRHLCARIPADVALGYHFCFGTLGGWPRFRPDDLGERLELDRRGHQ